MDTAERGGQRRGPEAVDLSSSRGPRGFHTHTHTPPPEPVKRARPTGATPTGGRGVADAPPKPPATRPAVRPPRRQGALWCSGASSARPGLGGSGLFTCALYASSLPASSLHSRSANMVGDSVSARYPVPSSSIRSSLAFPSLRGSFRAVCARGPVCLGAAGVRPGAASLADPIPTRLFSRGALGSRPGCSPLSPSYALTGSRSHQNREEGGAGHH